MLGIVSGEGNLYKNPWFGYVVKMCMSCISLVFKIRINSYQSKAHDKPFYLILESLLPELR